MQTGSRGTLWTRREALAAGVALGTILALPASRAGAAGFPDDALRPYLRKVGADPMVAAIGRAAAGGRNAHALETALRTRIPGARDEAGWRAGLLAAGREDLARGDFVDVLGRRLMLVEADFLGLAARLQPGA